MYLQVNLCSLFIILLLLTPHHASLAVVFDDECCAPLDHDEPSGNLHSLSLRYIAIIFHYMHYNSYSIMYFININQIIFFRVGSRLSDLFKSVFPYCNGARANRLIMDTEKGSFHQSRRRATLCKSNKSLLPRRRARKWH